MEGGLRGLQHDCRRDFEARDGGTLVHLTENGYEHSPVGLQDLLNRAQGWGCVLTLLTFFVEHGLTY